MSMTQEEIEALMNDTSFSEDETATEDNIDDILAGIDVLEDSSSDDIVEDNIDDILEGIDAIVEDKDDSKDALIEDDIDDILAGVDVLEDEEKSSNELEEDENNIDDILAGIDGIVEDEAKVNDTGDDTNKSDYPLPISNEHKVVNQLNEVAEDNEEKASQIFDAFSFILDENEKIQKNITDTQNFLDSQLLLLETLGRKFPNINVFLENLEEAQNLKIKNTEISEIIEGENNKIFEAMELMQYHDINRQKIERVMAVIRKLANYLNGIFSDDSNKPEVQIAKHISGDTSNTVDEDDLENLIAEFNK